MCDEEAVTMEMERVLKPGGAVLILDYDTLSRVDYLRSMHAVIEACVPEWPNLHHSFGVCVCIHTGMQPWRLGEDPDALTECMKKLGLTEVKASSCEVALATGMCYWYVLLVCEVAR